MADIVEAWMWAPPSAEMVDRLRARSAPRVRTVEAFVAPPVTVLRDRYYTQSRRLHVKRLMRGLA